MLNFAANGNRAGFVDLFAGVIADDLDFLRIIVDGLVHDHEVSLRSAVLEIGGSVHGNVDHALCDLFIEFFCNFLRRKVVPTALDGAGIIDNAGLTTSVYFGQRLTDQTGNEKDARANGTDKKCDGKRNADVELCLFWMILIYFVHFEAAPLYFVLAY